MEKFLRFLKLVGIPFVIAVAIYTFIRFVWLPNITKEADFQQITTSEYSKLYYDEKDALVFIYNSTSNNKEEYKSALQEKMSGKQTRLYSYDVTNLNEEEKTVFESATGLDSEEGYKLPLLVYIIDGRVYDFLEDYKESHYIVDFLERNDIR